MPTLSAERPEGVNGGELTITGFDIDLMAHAFGSDTLAAMPCTLAEPIVVDVTSEEEPEPAATSTGLTATSPEAGVVNLSATVTPDDAAGSVAFFEGDDQVGETVDVVEGVASVELTGVAAGEHTYTAVFTPADEEAFAGSASAEVSVTVAEVEEPAEPVETTIGLTATSPDAGVVVRDRDPG